MDVEVDGIATRPDRAVPPSVFDDRRFLLTIVLCGIGLGMTARTTVLYASSFGANPTVAGLTWSSLAVTLLAVDLFGCAHAPG